MTPLAAMMLLHERDALLLPGAAGPKTGLSTSEFARGAFAARQSMNVLLLALEREGYSR
jgi:hypothetical protein